MSNNEYNFNLARQLGAQLSGPLSELAVRMGTATRTLVSRAVFFDGSEDSWTAIEALGVENCSLSEHGFVYQWGQGTPVPRDTWVTLDESGIPIWEDFVVTEGDPR